MNLSIEFLIYRFTGFDTAQGLSDVANLATAELDLYSPLGLKLQLIQNVEMAGTAGPISPALMSKPNLPDKM